MTSRHRVKRQELKQGLAKAAFREYLEVLVAAVAIAFFIRTYVISAYRIPADSMAPTLLPGDFVLAFCLPYGIKIPFSGGKRFAVEQAKRGDVVTFRIPGNEAVSGVKRVVGLPGDRIAIVAERLLVNEGDAGAAEAAPDFGPVVVPPAHAFLLSDNRASTDDSRGWGAVPDGNLEGRVEAIWLSLDWSANGRADQSLEGRARIPSVRWNRISAVR